MPNWVEAVSSVLVFILSLFVTVVSWIFRRELQRSDQNMERVQMRIDDLERNATTHITRAETDIRLRQLELDIKATGSSMQEALREEMGKVNSRLDSIILSLNKRGP